VISRSGLEALGAVGFSSLQIEQDLLRVKGILYRDGGSDSIFWNLFGSKPHALPVLDYAPATSGYVISNDFRLGALYKHVREELVKLDIEEAVTGLQEFEKEFAQNMQVPLEKVLDSLDDEWTIILTLDESKMVESPMGTGDQIPEPGLVIMIKTKDNLVFDKITELSGETPVAGEGFKSIALPLPPLTEFLSPFVAQTDSGYLVIASQPSALASVLAAAAGKAPRLKDKESFKKVAKDMPKEGNSFSYTSGAFLKLVTNIQSTIGGATSEMNPYLQEAMTTAQKLNGQGDAVSFASSTEQGYIWIAQAISPAADTPEGGPAVMARLMASLLYGGVIEAASSTGDADDSEDAEATGTGAESTDVTE